MRLALTALTSAHWSDAATASLLMCLRASPKCLGKMNLACWSARCRVSLVQVKDRMAEPTSIFRGQHDRQDAGGDIWIGRIR